MDKDLKNEIKALMNRTNPTNMHEIQAELQSLYKKGHAPVDVVRATLDLFLELFVEKLNNLQNKTHTLH
jgi:hypothetical protein